MQGTQKPGKNSGSKRKECSTVLTAAAESRKRKTKYIFNVFAVYLQCRNHRWLRRDLFQ